MQDIREKTAVVIGGGSGIGMGIALGLADEGARVVVADIEPATAQGVAKRIADRGGDSIAVRTDATDPSSLAELVRISTGEFGAIHIMSNNVGVAHDKPLSELSSQDWNWIVEFNLLSIVRAVDTFLPQFRSQGGEAHIVNTASIAALLALPYSGQMRRHIGAYTTTKHAILGYTEMLRGELAAEGIGVSVLCPGLVQSNLAATAARNRPARHGGPGPEPPQLSDAARSQMMPPEQVGPIVVAGIRANRLHIFTHPELRDAVEQRHRRLLDDFDFYADLVR